MKKNRLKIIIQSDYKNYLVFSENVEFLIQAKTKTDAFKIFKSLEDEKIIGCKTVRYNFKNFK